MFNSHAKYRTGSTRTNPPSSWIFRLFSDLIPRRSLRTWKWSPRNQVPTNTYYLSKTTLMAPLVSTYRSTLRLNFALMMFKKAFIIEYYSTLILSDEIKYHTFWALCIEQSSSRSVISSYLQTTLCFSILFYLGI